MHFGRFLTEAGFKKDRNGNQLYFPFGAFGKGYVLPRSSKLKEEIQTFCAYNILISFSLFLIVLFWTRIPAYALVVFLVSFIIEWKQRKSWLKNLPVSDEKITISESLEAVAKSLNTVGLVFSVFFGAAGLIMTSFGFYIFLFKRDGEIPGLLGIFFFGTCTFIFIKVLLIRMKHQRDPRPGG